MATLNLLRAFTTGGFAALYDSLGSLETLGACRRGYFIEGLGGAQFALPGAVERLRARGGDDGRPPLVLGVTATMGFASAGSISAPPPSVYRLAALGP